MQRVFKLFGEGNGNPLQHSCLENSMDRGAWWATVHGVTKSWTWLSDTFILSIIIVACSFIMWINIFKTYRASMFSGCVLHILQISYLLLYFISSGDIHVFSCAWRFVTLWTIARRAPLSMGFSRHEYWSGFPLPLPGYLPTSSSRVSSRLRDWTHISYVSCIGRWILYH